MLAPAVIPVAAGKKMAKIVKNPCFVPSVSRKFGTKLVANTVAAII